MYQIFLERENIGSGKFKPISHEEWDQLIENDSELEATNVMEYISPLGEPCSRAGGFYALWKLPDSTKRAYFRFEDGVISTIYDSQTLQKMRQFSLHFHGFIYGEVGEEY